MKQKVLWATILVAIAADQLIKHVLMQSNPTFDCYDTFKYRDMLFPVWGAILGVSWFIVDRYQAKISQSNTRMSRILTICMYVLMPFFGMFFGQIYLNLRANFGDI